MSFYTNYPNRKDWRTPYRKPKSFDASCRNHGSDPWSTHNRLYNHYRTEQESLAELRAFRLGHYTTPLYAPVDEHEEQLFSYNYWDYI